LLEQGPPPEWNCPPPVEKAAGAQPPTTPLS
jgi:hypothetical protein